MSDILKEPSGDKPLQIRRGRVDSVDIYEIKDSELERLEQGSPAGLYLNFAIFLFSIAFTSLVALCTTATFKYPFMQTLFALFMVVGFLMGLFLFLLWNRARKDNARIIKQIRRRIPPEIPSTIGTATDDEILPKEPPPNLDPKG